MKTDKTGLVPCLVIAWTAINGDAEDALALFQIIEARVDEAVTVELAACFSLGQTLGLFKRDTMQLLLALGSGDVDGVGDAVAYRYQVIVVVAAARYGNTYARIRTSCT